jgi:hypothetical protein
MCFSASASFGASALLGVIGIAAIKKSTSSSQTLFAAIPLIFAVQQTIEGFLWLSLTHTAYASWHQPATYIFLIFAQVLWPTWVPLSIVLLEKHPLKKRILYAGLGTGLLVSVYLAYRLFTQNINSAIMGYHISYNIGIHSTVFHLSSVLYIAAAVIPPFVSSVKRMWLFGFTTAGSYVVSQLFFTNYVISVWCFFAAVISIAVFTIILGLYRTFTEGSAPTSLVFEN